MDTFEISLGSPSVLVRQPEAFPERYHYREGILRGGKLILPDVEEGSPERVECEKYDDMYRIAVCSTDQAIENIIQVDFTDLPG